MFLGLAMASMTEDAHVSLKDSDPPHTHRMYLGSETL